MTMSIKEKTSSVPAGTPRPTEPEPMEWSSEDETQLLFALDGLKPVGVNKYFYMVGILERMSSSLKREILPEAIWAHLRTKYNLELLDDVEPLPFPNEESEFKLPEEYSSLLSKKITEEEKPTAPVTVGSENNAANTDNVAKEKTTTPPSKPNLSIFMDKKLSAKLQDVSKHRSQKRTRGATSLESPSTTPPPTPIVKRRRI